MTTAARPTFEPARGGKGKGEGDLSALSKQYSSRDLPSHTKLKYRQPGQSTSEELRGRDFRQELEDKEKEAREKSSKEKRSFTEVPSVTGSDTRSRSSKEEGGSSTKKPRIEPPASLDADDVIDDDDDEDEEDSDEDDTAELLRELQKIKKERAEEQAKKERERKEEEERIRTENLLKGNPLLNQQQQQKGTFQIKRRWDDDVIFKNCAKSDFDKKEQHFINDTIRSEFHRKFMDKYVK